MGVRLMKCRINGGEREVMVDVRSSRRCNASEKVKIVVGIERRRQWMRR